MISDGKKPFRQYAGICASGQSVKTTLIRLYSIILQTALDIAKELNMRIILIHITH